MALADNFNAIRRGFTQLPIMRQLVLLVSLSVSIALGFSIVLWLNEPNYRALYTNLPTENAGLVINALQQSGIPYKFDVDSGTLLIPAKQFAQAQLKIAGSGVSKEITSGFDWLSKNESLGTSRFIEDARYKRALEEELAKTISEINGVQGARVHLAIPKQAIFVSSQAKTTASILLKVSPGYKLDEAQIAAIVRMVASSITGLNPEDVSVADQDGKLLTSDLNSAFAQSKEEFNYQNKLEREYESRIVSLLLPLIGPNKVQARVAIDLDFTQHEITRETYEPEKKAVRSEQTISEEKTSSSSTGTPGAAANDADTEASPKQGAAGRTSRSQTVRNYELGKSISYEKHPSGNIKRLSIAVIIDDYTKVDEKTGEVTRTKLNEEEIQRLTALIKNAVGFNEERGDKISVVNSSFAQPEIIADIPPIPFYKQPWFLEIGKKIGVAFFVLLLAMIILRPLFKSLASKGQAASHPSAENSQAAYMNALSNSEITTPEMMKLKQQQIDSLKQMVSQDPTRVAQVLKNWLGDK